MNYPIFDITPKSSILPLIIICALIWLLYSAFLTLKGIFACKRNEYESDIYFRHAAFGIVLALLAPFVYAEIHGTYFSHQVAEKIEKAYNFSRMRLEPEGIDPLDSDEEPYGLLGVTKTGDFVVAHVVFNNNKTKFVLWKPAPSPKDALDK